MFGIFKKASPVKKMYKTYRNLLEESHRLSTVDRRASDKKYVEAQNLLEEIEKINSKINQN